jgi:hypothetical protein
VNGIAAAASDAYDLYASACDRRLIDKHFYAVGTHFYFFHYL